MNPICLLTTGRTYKEATDRPGAYKLLAQTAPVKRPAKRVPARPSRPAPEPDQRSLFERVPEPVKPVEVEEPAAVAPDVVVAPSVVEPAAKEEPAKQNPFAGARSKPVPRAVTVCKEWLQHLAVWRKRHPVASQTVQGEFALEKVTVVRNDLNEDDLEVVLVERKVGTGEKPLARLSKMEMPTEAWTWLTAAFHKKSSESAISPKAETQPSPELSARA